MLQTGKMSSTGNQAQAISHLQGQIMGGKSQQISEKGPPQVGDKRPRMNATFASQVFNEFQELKKKRAVINADENGQSKVSDIRLQNLLNSVNKEASIRYKNEDHKHFGGIMPEGVQKFTKNKINFDQEDSNRETLKSGIQTLQSLKQEQKWTSVFDE